MKAAAACLLLCLFSAVARAQLNPEGAYAGDVDRADGDELVTVIVRAGDRGRLTGRLIWTTTDPVTGYYLPKSAEGRGRVKKTRVGVRYGNLGRFVGRVNAQGDIEGRLILRRSRFDPYLTLVFSPSAPPHEGGVIVHYDPGPGVGGYPRDPVPRPNLPDLQVPVNP